ncbi:MAG: hypothetical protein PHV13_03360 [Candidatus ainarchaeum sp.]|nr:hypothetical protein [Candidatus ainarchaeum sp.]
MEITPRELARLIELNKKRAELEFRGSALGMDCAAELRSITANADEIASKARAARVEIILPGEKKLQALGAALSSFSPQQLKEALVGRAGQAYELLVQRGGLVKQNHENRLEIAKLSMALARMPSHDRDMVAAMVRSGSFEGTLQLAFTSEAVVRDTARYLRRCGMGCKASGRSLAADKAPNAEVRMELSNRKVWVSESVRAQLEENLKGIHALTAGIQLKNAERQIKQFSEQEEDEFVTLQRKYLDLLKQQDELLKEFNEEESASFRQG